MLGLFSARIISRAGIRRAARRGPARPGVSSSCGGGRRLGRRTNARGDVDAGEARDAGGRLTGRRAAFPRRGCVAHDVPNAAAASFSFRILAQLLLHCALKVVEQGLTPRLARRACGDPKITGPILSREISKAVSVRAEDIIARHRAAGDLMDFAEGEGGKGPGEDKGGGRKRLRRHSTGAASFVSPNPGETQAAAIVAVPRASFNAPYLKGGPTHSIS